MLSNCFMYKVVLLLAEFTKLLFSLNLKNNQVQIILQKHVSKNNNHGKTSSYWIIKT